MNITPSPEFIEAYNAIKLPLQNQAPSKAKLNQWLKSQGLDNNDAKNTIAQIINNHEIEQAFILAKIAIESGFNDAQEVLNPFTEQVPTEKPASPYTAENPPYPDDEFEINPVVEDIEVPDLDATTSLEEQYKIRQLAKLLGRFKKDRLLEVLANTPSLLQPDKKNELVETLGYTPKYDKSVLARQGLISNLFINRLEREGELVRKSIDKNMCFYNGEYWQSIEVDKAQEYVREFCLALDATDQTFSTQSMITNIYSNLMGFLEQLPKPTNYINLKNKTIEITANGVDLVDFNHTHGLRYKLDYDYNPDATCSMFDKYLSEALPDADARKTLQQYFAAVLLRDDRVEESLFLTGGGGNGKSVMFDIITAIFGKQNISHTAIDKLDNEIHRVDMCDKFINYCADAGEKIRRSEIFKTLSSGEPMTARRLYQQPFKMENYGKMVFNCNALPDCADTSEGYYRRLIIIPFNVSFRGAANEDTNLSGKIISSELSGILNWIIAGAQELIKNNGKIELCKVTHDARADYQNSLDSVKAYLQEEELIAGDEDNIEHRITWSSFYQNYEEWCMRKGYEETRVVTKIQLGRKLQSVYHFTKKRNRGTDYIWRKKVTQ